MWNYGDSYGSNDNSWRGIHIILSYDYGEINMTVKDKELMKEKMDYLQSYRMLWRSRRTITLQIIDNMIDVMSYLFDELEAKKGKK